MFEFFRATNPAAVQWPLYSVLNNFRDTKATDPRDMIFALVGIHNDNQISGFAVNYHQSVKELYNLVTHSIFTKHGLNALYKAGITSRSLNELPSWVID